MLTKETFLIILQNPIYHYLHKSSSPIFYLVHTTYKIQERIQKFFVIFTDNNQMKIRLNFEESMYKVLMPYLMVKCV